MQTRLARSWSALRYDLSSQRALDNASQMRTEHDRLLAEIDALARRLTPRPGPDSRAGAPSPNPRRPCHRAASGRSSGPCIGW
jgi:hypothetical protein